MIVNNRVYIIFSFLCFAIFWSCQDEVEEYYGKQGIYFYAKDTKNKVTEQTELPFALTEANDSLLRIRVKVLGTPASFNREFKVKIVEDETTTVNGDYSNFVNTYTIPADSIYGYVAINFHKQSSLKDKSRMLTIEILPNKYFDISMKVFKAYSSSDPINVLKHKIKVSDEMIQLPGFNTFFLGDYSKKKLDIVCQLFNIKWTVFLKKLDYVVIKAMGQNLDRYFKKMQKEGTPIYEEKPDENGNLVLMKVGKGVHM